MLIKNNKNNIYHGRRPRQMKVIMLAYLHIQDHQIQMNIQLITWKKNHLTLFSCD